MVEQAMKQMQQESGPLVRGEQLTERGAKVTRYLDLLDCIGQLPDTHAVRAYKSFVGRHFLSPAQFLKQNPREAQALSALYEAATDNARRIVENAPAPAQFSTANVKSPDDVDRELYRVTVENDQQRRAMLVQLTETFRPSPTPAPASPKPTPTTAHTTTFNEGMTPDELTVMLTEGFQGLAAALNDANERAAEQDVIQQQRRMLANVKTPDDLRKLTGR